MSQIRETFGGVYSPEHHNRALTQRLANNLLCPVEVMERKLSEFGAGHIYTPGIVLLDSIRNREQAKKIYGSFVVIKFNGDVYVYVSERKSRLKPSKCRIDPKKEAREREQRIADRQYRIAYAEQKKADKLHNDGMTIPNKKRGGKGNSRSDWGKVYYVNVPAVTMDIFTPRATTRKSGVKVPN